MRIVIELGTGLELFGDRFARWDKRLRSYIPNLIGWSYSPQSGELILDCNDGDDEEAIMQRIDQIHNVIGGKKIRTVEIYGEALRRWQG